MFSWNPEKIRFLKDASDYTPFNDILAARAAAVLPAGAHVCDAGCGLGYLSLALAGHCAHVTAADCSEAALAILRQNLAAGAVRNLSIWRGDVFSMPADMRFDAMTFCFFGKTKEVLACAKSRCGGNVVLFKKNWATHRFTLTKTPLEKDTFRAVCGELDALGVLYESASFSLDMGQPFRSLSDAAAFFRLHGGSGADEAVTGTDAESLLIRTDSREFPYYLPADRPVGMIVLDAGAIPDTITG